MSIIREKILRQLAQKIFIREVKDPPLKGLPEKEEENLYESVWINNYEKHDVNKPLIDMEEWSALSTKPNYVHYDKCTNGYFKMNIRAPEERYNSKICTKFHACQRILKILILTIRVS